MTYKHFIDQVCLIEILVVIKFYRPNSFMHILCCSAFPKKILPTVNMYDLHRLESVYVTI